VITKKYLLQSSGPRKKKGLGIKNPRGGVGIVTRRLLLILRRSKTLKKSPKLGYSGMTHATAGGLDQCS